MNPIIYNGSNAIQMKPKISDALLVKKKEGKKGDRALVPISRVLYAIN